MKCFNVVFSKLETQLKARLAGPGEEGIGIHQGI